MNVLSGHHEFFCTSSATLGHSAPDGLVESIQTIQTLNPWSLMLSISALLTAVQINHLE